MQNNYDVIIVWGWATGLFVSITAPKNISKLILEKNQSAWIKVLLSGWERANVSNIDILPERDYFWQNKKALLSMFKKFNNYDTISFFEENNVSILEEDRGRLILKSWNSKELLNVLLEKSTKNNTTLKTNSWVLNIIKKWDLFEIETISWEKYFSKKVVITSWWKSFAQVWTTWDWYNWAKNFWHTLKSPHRWLCGLVSIRDLKEISWVSCDLNLEVYSKTSKKPIYNEFWPILFTHFWVSWPIIFNAAVAIWQHINSLKLDEFIETLNFWKIPENEKQDFIERNYIKENIFLKLTFSLENIPKRLVWFFWLTQDENEVTLNLQDYRSWREAKVTWWWINIDELTNNLESKIIPNLYFWWEILDITWKTWWFNLQLAWTTWYVIWKSL